jgi:hypothetical protein
LQASCTIDHASASQLQRRCNSQDDLTPGSWQGLSG